jgi:hypothetical protein
MPTNIFEYEHDDETAELTDDETTTYITDELTDDETTTDITDEEIDYEPVYEPEEQSLTKYNIVLCERYDRNKHGIVNGEINDHYLTLIRFTELDSNYINIVTSSYNAKVEIAECLYLPSEHCVSIIKTHWLKLIQRTWKRIYILRKLIIVMRSCPNALNHMEIYGRWPNNCLNYPTLKGMLKNLSRIS